MQKLTEIEKKYSFKNLSKRQPGEEDSGSFLRKGIAGDWRNKFDRAACEVFDHFAGENLVRMGYEKDRNWRVGCRERN